MVKQLSGGIFAVRGFKRMPGQYDDENDKFTTNAMYAISPYGADDDTDILFFNAQWVKRIGRDTEVSSVGGYAIPIKLPPGADTIIVALDND